MAGTEAETQAAHTARWPVRREKLRRHILHGGRYGERNSGGTYCTVAGTERATGLSIKAATTETSAKAGATELSIRTVATKLSINARRRRRWRRSRLARRRSSSRSERWQRRSSPSITAEKAKQGGSFSEGDDRAVVISSVVMRLSGIRVEVLALQRPTLISPPLGTLAFWAVPWRWRSPPGAIVRNAVGLSI